MDFRILLTDEPEPNSAEITIFGLGSGTRHLFSEEHQAIEFHAGYGDNTALIFKGVTVNVFHEKSDVTWETTIFAYDGLDALVDPRNKFKKSYKKGVKISRIVKDLATHLDIPHKIGVISDSDRTPYGVAYCGMPKAVLNQIAIDYDLEWSIQNGELLVYGARTLLNPTSIVLTPETGLIGSPVVSERTEQLKKKRKKKAKPKRIPYVEVTSLLNHQIRPGALIKIESNRTLVRTGKPSTEKAKKTEANGLYYVTTARFLGSNYDLDYYVEATADAGEDIFFYKTFNGAKTSDV